MESVEDKKRQVESSSQFVLVLPLSQVTSCRSPRIPPTCHHESFEARESPEPSNFYALPKGHGLHVTIIASPKLTRNN
jgi:hypothetical protein